MKKILTLLMLLFVVTTLTFSQDVQHSFYKLHYNQITKQADYVAYCLKHENLNGSEERASSFISDPLIENFQVCLKDYYKSGFDKGHLCPAADMSFNEIAMRESFYYSNVSPQLPGFNRGIWKELETHLRNIASNYDSILIVTGPLFLKDLGNIGEHQIKIPSHFYKVIVACNHGKYNGIGFLFPNEKSEKDIFDYIETIDHVEQQTKLDFFKEFPDQIENKMELNEIIEDFK